MRLYIKSTALVAGLLFAMPGFAQVFDVCSGNGCPHQVPLSPAVTIVISLALALAAFVALRRHSRGAAMLLAGGVIAAGWVVHDTQLAWATTDMTLLGPDNHQVLTCSGPDLTINNNSGATVPLRINQLSGTVHPHTGDDCRDAPQSPLPSGVTCSLPCGAVK